VLCVKALSNPCFEELRERRDQRAQRLSPPVRIQSRQLRIQHGAVQLLHPARLAPEMNHACHIARIAIPASAHIYQY
jgi:hypothetical protein